MPRTETLEGVPKLELCLVSKLIKSCMCLSRISDAPHCSSAVGGGAAGGSLAAMTSSLAPAVLAAVLSLAAPAPAAAANSCARGARVSPCLCPRCRASTRHACARAGGLVPHTSTGPQVAPVGPPAARPARARPSQSD